MASDENRKRLALAVLYLLAAAPVAASDAVAALIENRLAQELGRPAGFADLSRRSAGDWVYLCATPVEIDGAPFNYAQSEFAGRMAAGELEDRFCVLLSRRNMGVELVEFDLGSTDMTIIDWIDRHDVPEEILDKLPTE